MAIGWDGASTAYAASHDGRVWAFDINTGKVLWWSTYPSSSAQEWRVTVSASTGLVAIQVAGENSEETPPSFTVLRADNGEPVPDVNAASFGKLKDGVLMTSDSSGSSTVYIPS